MTQNRLDELMEKVARKEIDLNDLAEICGAVLQSTSRHSKDIKNRLSTLEKRLDDIEKNMDSIKDLSSPAFGIISDMEDPDQD
jgi:phage shock protein A